MMELNDTLARIGLSLLLAMPIGWEREISHKAAGLRTHLLVSVGCCLFMLVSLSVAGMGRPGTFDPGRIAAQIVTGIGFLGGGAILRAGGAIRGLTTAASIWSVAGIGMACGAGYYTGALAGTLAVLVVLAGVTRWERRFLGLKRLMTIRIRMRAGEGIQRAREIMDGLGLQAEETSIQTSGDEQTLCVKGAFELGAVAVAFRELAEDPDMLGIDKQVG